MVIPKKLALWTALYFECVVGRLGVLLPPLLPPVVRQRVMVWRMRRVDEQWMKEIRELQDYYTRRGGTESQRALEDLKHHEARLLEELRYLRMGVFPPIPPPAPKNP